MKHRLLLVALALMVALTGCTAGPSSSADEGDAIGDGEQVTVKELPEQGVVCFIYDRHPDWDKGASIDCIPEDQLSAGGYE